MDKPTCAILARTNLALRIFEQALSEQGIPYHLIGKSGYWASAEIKAGLSYLGCVLYPADWLIAGAIRAPFWPTRYLPKSKLLAALKEQHGSEVDPSKNAYFNYMVRIPELLVDPKNLGSLREFVTFLHSLSRYRDMKPDEALKHLLTVLKAVEYYREEEITPDSNTLDNLAELIKLASRHSSIKEFLDYTRRASAASKSRRGVSLATCHAAKGMEFKRVFLVGVQEGLFPHAKSDDLESERNCFFVGCSRAERELFLTYVGNPSPFISGIIDSNKEPKNEDQ